MSNESKKVKKIIELINKGNIELDAKNEVRLSEELYEALKDFVKEYYQLEDNLANPENIDHHINKFLAESVRFYLEGEKLKKEKILEKTREVWRN